MTKKKMEQYVAFSICGLFALLAVVVLFAMFYYIIRGGASVISWSFITEPPRSNMTEGGVWPAIVGTFYVSVLTVVFFSTGRYWGSDLFE